MKYNFIEFEENFPNAFINREKYLIYEGEESIYNSIYTMKCEKCLSYVYKNNINNHWTNKCFTNSLVCFNCFQIFPLKEYLIHNIRINRCLRSEYFYRNEVDILLFKIFNIKNNNKSEKDDVNKTISFPFDNFKFLDYYFEKDEFYKTNSFDILIKRICDDLINTKYTYNFKAIKYFENYLFTEKFSKSYYDLFIKKMGEFISNQLDKEYWAEAVKY